MTTCTHHWILGKTQSGKDTLDESTPARCKLCGKERVFVHRHPLDNMLCRTKPKLILPHLNDPDRHKLPPFRTHDR